MTSCGVILIILLLWLLTLLLMQQTKLWNTSKMNDNQFMRFGCCIYQQHVLARLPCLTVHLHWTLHRKWCSILKPNYLDDSENPLNDWRQLTSYPGPIIIIIFLYLQQPSGNNQMYQLTLTWDAIQAQYWRYMVEHMSFLFQFFPFHEAP